MIIAIGRFFCFKKARLTSYSFVYPLFKMISSHMQDSVFLTQRQPICSQKLKRRDTAFYSYGIPSGITVSLQW